MPNWAERNIGILLQSIILIVMATGTFFITQTKAENAMKQSLNNKTHMIMLEKEYAGHCIKDAESKGAIKSDINVIKNQMKNLNDRMREQTVIQADTNKKVDRLSDILLQFINDEHIGRNN